MRDDLLHRAGEFIPLGVQLDQFLGRRHRAQRADQLFLHQFAHGIGLNVLAAQRAGGLQDVIGVGLDLDVELGRQIDAQIVRGDQRMRPAAFDVQPHRFQRNGDDMMNHRQHDRCRRRG